METALTIIQSKIVEQATQKAYAEYKDDPWAFIKVLPSVEISRITENTNHTLTTIIGNTWDISRNLRDLACKNRIASLVDKMTTEIVTNAIKSSLETPLQESK